MIRWRRQKYWACSLIAAINARIYLGGKDVSDRQFERLVDFTCGRVGACFQSTMPRVYKRLGLRVKKGTKSISWIANHLPVEIAYFDKKYGFHASLVVGVKGKSLQLVNAWKTKVQWRHIHFAPKHLWCFRSFSLIAQ
jgi:hypothetical protein